MHARAVEQARSPWPRLSAAERARQAACYGYCRRCGGPLVQRWREDADSLSYGLACLDSEGRHQ
jgi:hypothetical protein